MVYILLYYYVYYLHIYSISGTGLAYLFYIRIWIGIFILYPDPGLVKIAEVDYLQW